MRKDGAQTFVSMVVVDQGSSCFTTSSCAAGFGTFLNWNRSASPGSGEANSTVQGASQAASSPGALTRANFPFDSALNPMASSSKGTISNNSWGPTAGASFTSNPLNRWHRSAMSRNSSGPTCTLLPNLDTHSSVWYSSP